MELEFFKKPFPLHGKYHCIHNDNGKVKLFKKNKKYPLAKSTIILVEVLTVTIKENKMTLVLWSNGKFIILFFNLYKGFPDAMLGSAIKEF